MAGFDDLYTSQGKPVYRFLLSLTGDPHQAEELLQETHDPLRFLIIPPCSTVQVEDTLFAASNSTK